MQETEEKTAWFYVDESGDPAFYGKGGRVIVGQPGCSRIFLLGFVQVEDPNPIRQRLDELSAEIARDRYLQSIPSFKKTLRGFHAKDDCAEVRMMIFKALAESQFNAQVVVARKFEPMFRTRFKGSQDLFYDELVSRLFENHLHKAQTNIIVFSRRGKKTRQHAMHAAVQKAADRFQKKWKSQVNTRIDIRTLRSSEDRLLQVVDYANWAVQRAYEHNQMRYFDWLGEKFSLVWDIYDKARYKGGGNFYTQTKNPFDIKKASSLG